MLLHVTLHLELHAAQKVQILGGAAFASSDWSDYSGRIQ
jgi:hypothetical protein